MSAEEGYCMILCTCPGDGLAEELANTLVRQKLAACVQIAPIRSFYEWKGEVCRDEERLLMIKSRSALYGEIERFITGKHPYEVPEVLKIDITGGLGAYLSWVDSVTGRYL